jgi:3-oxoacyl-[acyl-carrier-protein] synthase II
LVEVVVTGIGLISALGRLKLSWCRLLQGESGIQQHQPFANLPSRPLALLGQAPSALEHLTALVVADALQDAGLVMPLSDCGVVIGSSRGCQGSWEQLLQRGRSGIASVLDHGSYHPVELTAANLANPVVSLESWLDTLPQRGAIATAHQIGSMGPVLAPMAACATGIWAIAQGVELIKTGQCQRVLAGAVEAPITPLTLAGFAKMGALAEAGCYPFDQNRQGLVLGEGAAVLVLESAQLARKRSAFIYGQVLGFGLTCDAFHATAPDPIRRCGLSAIKQCLERSQLAAKDIDYIHAHGTSTQLNDQNEAQLIQQLFGLGVAVSSTKGATGHTLGASGAMGAAFCLMALQEQQMPPCVGLKTPAFELDFVTIPRQSEIENVLCFSFGFGGQNAVLALRKEFT